MSDLFLAKIEEARLARGDRCYCAVSFLLYEVVVEMKRSPSGADVPKQAMTSSRRVTTTKKFEDSSLFSAGLRLLQ